MPITPFHFGPGAAVYAVAPQQVSFLAFCAANVLIDVESLYNLVRGNAQVHAFFHTYVGATLVALAMVGAWALLRRVLPPRWVGGLTLKRVAVGALLGAWSHVVLDSVMHVDIQPLQPLSADNGLFRIVSLLTLHGACVAAALGALAVMGVRRLLARRG
ncbi:hypothetical protein ACG02S_11030 [Roseateles sp. DC23W]|uniref:LexA-binding, inner membrane-associated hydrolase n=1 Tax=Pelomonas dachongensis TaxID=3299029 RepID=A0ABW7ENH0_9BURK